MRKILLACVCTLAVACSTATERPVTLYQQLGGAEGVDALVYQLLVNIAKDDRVVARFRGVDIEKFRAGFSLYICSVSDGDCTYNGDSMQVIHAGYQYSDREFNAIVDNLMQAMDEQGIATPVQNALLARLAPTYKDVVYQ